jgi:hypothetical protein
VYSPDGADWLDTEGRFLSSFRASTSFDLGYYRSHQSITGNGADTVGFTAAVQENLFGMPYNWNDTAMTIEIGPVTPNSAGRTICIDSSFYRPMNSWKWVGVAGDAYSPYYPWWDGPHCYDVTAAIEIHGRLLYVDSTPGSPGTRPIRGASVIAYDEDQTPDDDPLGLAYTDNDGRFHMYDIPSGDDDEGGDVDIYFTFRPDNRAATVYLNDGYVGEYRSATEWDFPGGSYSPTVTCDSLSEAFYVADVILEGCTTWEALVPSDTGSTWVNVYLSNYADSITSAYSHVYNVIIINDSTDVGADMFTRAWSRSEVLHEYGHKIAYSRGFADNGGGGHSVYDITTPDAAGAEGFAHFFSALVRDTSLAVTYRNAFADSSWCNWENGLYGSTSQTHGTVNCLGGSNEGAVAGILWDIYDQSHDGYSGYGDWGSTTLPHYPDNVWDSLWDGPDNILEALMVREVTSPGNTPKRHPDNIHEFYSAWYQQPILGHCREVYNIFYEHGDTSVSPPKKGECSCCENMGDFSHSGNPVPDITDLIYAVTYMFQDGWEPPCMDETDVDGNGSGPDIADLTYLVVYMFQDGPDIAPCP